MRRWNRRMRKQIEVLQREFTYAVSSKPERVQREVLREFAIIDARQPTFRECVASAREYESRIEVRAWRWLCRQLSWQRGL